MFYRTHQGRIHKNNPNGNFPFSDGEFHSNEKILLPMKSANKKSNLSWNTSQLSNHSYLNNLLSLTIDLTNKKFVYNKETFKKKWED